MMHSMRGIILLALVAVVAADPNRAFIELIDGVCPRKPTIPVTTNPGGGGGTTAPPQPTVTLPPPGLCPKSAFRDECGKYTDGFSVWFGQDEHVFFFEDGTSFLTWDNSAAGGEGTITLTGWVSNPAHPEWGRWWVYVMGYKRSTSTEPNPTFPPTAAGFKLELEPSCYGTGPGQVNIESFILYVDWKGWLIEYENIDPAQTDAALNPTGRVFYNVERGPPLMFGHGANNKNRAMGISFWMSWVAMPLQGYNPTFPLPNWTRGTAGKGDFNLDTPACPPGHPSPDIWKPDVQDFCGLVYYWTESWLPTCNTMLLEEAQAAAEEEAAVALANAKQVGLLAPDCTNNVDNLIISGDAILETDPNTSGFHNKDQLSIYVLVPRKYENVVVTLGLSVGKEIVVGPFPMANSCYDRYIATALWTNYVAEGEIASEEVSSGGSQFRQFTGSAHVTMEEELNDIRGTKPPRIIISELPFIVLFPKTVTATVDSINAFYCVNLAAAIIRQEVQVNLAQLNDPEGYLRIFTSTQWPFKLHSPNIGGASPAVDARFEKIDMGLMEDCVDPAAGPLIPGATPDDSLACTQIWMVNLNPAVGTCTLDGDYVVEFLTACQPSFVTGANNCPINPSYDDYVAFNFRLDSENFCPQVVDNVDISASISVFKDLAHLIPATNFILDQTSYFVLGASSTKVSVASITITQVSLVTPSDPGAHKIIWANGGPSATVPMVDLAVNNHDASGLHSDAWFQFKINEGALFAPPADGSIDFDVHVTADIVFKGNNNILLERSGVNLLAPAGISSANSKTQETRHVVAMTAVTNEFDASSVGSSSAVGGFLALASLLVAGQL